MDSIDSRQLRAFVSVAQTGSFTEGAKRLFLTQSAVSHSVRGLEEDLGCRLMERAGKRVYLTQAGEHLLQYANRILDSMKRAREEIEGLGKWGRGRLRLAASATSCQYLLPSVLREFRESFPQCSISIAPGDGGVSLELLQQNRADLALIPDPGKTGDFTFRPLFQDDLVFIMSPLHPWARAGKVNRKEIAQQQFILYLRQSFTSRMIESYFAKERLVLPVSMELGSMEAIKELVKLGLGISILAPWIAAQELEQGSLAVLPLGTRPLKRTWGVAYLKERRLSLAEETFVGLCQTVSHTLLAAPSTSARRPSRAVGTSSRAMKSKVR